MLNKLMLQGRFTGTPELRSTLDGINVVRFTIASQRDRANKDGEREADFIQCVAWRGTAEFICRYFAKGQGAVIEGALRSGKWVEDDKTRYGVEVEVSEIHFCGGKNENAERRMQNAENGARDDEAAHNGGWSAPGENAFSLGDDDVPF